MNKELEMRQRLKDDFEFYARNCLKVRIKGGNITNFELNKAQKYLHAMVENQLKETGKVRVLVLKGRQQGATTYIQGRFYWKVTHSFGKRVFILTHEENATTNLFEMAKRYHENCLPALKPTIKFSNAKELVFDKLDSGYKLGTAGNKSVGRSSTIQFLHCSEAAFYKHADEHAKGIMQAVPNADATEVFIESTANGVGNWFHQMWQAAEAGTSEYIPIFLPWFWQDEYRNEVPVDFKTTPEEIELQRIYHLDEEQLVWRRIKIAEFSSGGADGLRWFNQEYPCNPVEAFLTSDEHNTFITSDLIMSARTCQPEPEAYGPLLIGVDPARFGDDRTAIIRRRGRVAYNLESFVKLDTMQVVGIVHKIINEEKPDVVFVDVGGLGAGVIDRLNELGYRDIVKPVNSGTRPLNEKKYKNKRAEMWGLGKEWLQDYPCKIPDSDSLHADLCGPKYTWTSNTQLLIESKQDMRTRHVRSSDEADALLLTFALPKTAYDKSTRRDREALAAKVMSGYNKILTDKKMRKN